MPLATQSSNQPYSQPLGGSNGNLRYRLLHFHVPLAVASAVVLLVWMSFPLFQTAGHQGQPTAGAPSTMHQGGNHQSTPQESNHETGQQGQSQTDSGMSSMNHSGNQATNSDRNQSRWLARFTTATGYIALGLLGLTLLLGPANLLLRRRVPISSYLTRDVGIWAAVVSVIHVAVGLFVHGPPAPLLQRIRFYFFTPNGSPLTNNFGWGNWTGLAATVIVVGLLAISSDAALRKLKARRWKNLQRLNYALFALVLAHAIFYGALLRITSITTILLGIIVSLVFIGQMVGVWLWRQRHARSASGLV
jgi:methionine sulfoxide reductase heme-binding subunit